VQSLGFISYYNLELCTLNFALCTLNFRILLLALFLVPCLAVNAQKSAYFDYIQHTAETNWERYPEVIERWKSNVDPSVLWGYNSPSHPIYLADIFGFLYEQTGEATHAERAAQLLYEYGSLRDVYPEDYYKTRIEYENGVPALSNFFFLPPYSRSYLRIKDSDALTPEMRETIEKDLAYSLDFQFHFPEWGAHNRALLRAEGWYYGYLAMPGHPHALKWKQMAEIVAQDNLTQWEIEDASGYQAIWLASLLSYAEIAGHEELMYNSSLIRYYAEYFKQMFTPASTMPAFGDSNWNPGWDRFIAVFEKLGGLYQDEELKWIAKQLLEKAVTENRYGVVAASHLTMAHQWTDESVAATRPQSGSQEVLEDLSGKKVVFRNGWDPTSTYLLLNYRDEGDGGSPHRDYLRNTLTVEEEKAHHGQADENDIPLLMSGGSVLLHSSGYRSGLPSGPLGQFRADYYQNKLVVRKNKRDATQPVDQFLYNSGAYRPVRTQKVEFHAFDKTEMSRTRVIDDKMGYAWDRIITYLKEDDTFVVVDAVQATVEDYFTYTNLWHTRQVHNSGTDYYDTSIDSIRSVALPADKRLLIQFLETNAKEIGVYPERRHFQDEQAIYQTQSSHYLAGDYEVFVTVLKPHAASASPESMLSTYQLIKPTSFPDGVAIQINHQAETAYLCLKLDLESELARENIRPRYTWEKGRIAYGPIETDAHFLYASVKDDALYYEASQFLNIFYNGNAVFEALPNTHGLQPDGSDPKVGYTKWRAWSDEVRI